MPVFVYRGRHRSGRPAHGELNASSVKDALRLLREREIAVTQLREQPARTTWGQLPWIGSREPRIAARHRAVFTAQLGTLLDAGVPLLTGLDMLAASAEPHRFRRVLSVVRQDVENGMMLSASLRRHPTVFPDWYSNMVEIGEVTGLLDHVLARLAAYEERCAERKKKMLAALAYPIVLVGIAGAVFLCLVVWIVPLFEQLFAELDGTLPWLTQVVIDGSVAVRTYGGWGLLLAIMVGMGIWMGYHTPGGRVLGDRWLLRLPLLGELLRKSASTSFAEILGILLKSGVPILEGLRMTAANVGNAVMAQAIHAVRVSVSQGKPVSEPLARSGVFPPMVAQMIAVGESSGTLDTMLEKIAAMYEHETTHAISTLTAMLEPVVILVIGLGIGVLVVAMYLPIFTMGAFIG